jgi:hypothetical protein
MATIQASPFNASTAEDFMHNEAPEASEAEVGTEENANLLARAISLAGRVEAMPDGAMKEKLRAELAEMRSNLGERKPEVRHAG